MIRFFSKHVLYFVVGVIPGLLLDADAQVNPSNTGGPFKFRGVTGPSLSNSMQKPMALMVADVPAEKVKKECVFFGGDSLTGFDFNQASSAAALNGAKMYSEFRAFMFLEQAAFVKKKYNIKALPYEINNTNNQNKKEGPPVITASCNNLDFENGNFGGWSTARGYNFTSGSPLTVMQSPTPYISTNNPFDACDDLNIITSAYGNDPYGGFPGLNPTGGTYSARLGGRDMNTAACVAFWACDATKYFCNGFDPISYSNGEQLSQTFLVTAANALVSFDYAVLLCDGGHAAGQQCYFQVAITDAGGGALSPPACYSYYVEAIAGVPPNGFVNSGFTSPSDGTPIYKQSWTSNSINLTPYIGTNVTMKFMAAGCVLGGHPAWAYIDASCGAVDIDVTPLSPCLGSTGVLTAPAVMNGSYSWSGPGIVGSTTGQSVTVNATGTYFVTVTPSQGPGCAYTLSVPVTFSSPSVLSTSSTPAGCTVTNGTATATGTGGAGGYSYSWSPGGQATQTAVGLAAGTTYTCTITDANGCTVKATVTVGTTAAPTVSSTSSTAAGCTVSNGTATANPSGGTGSYTYSWSPGGQATQTAVGLAAGTTYTCTITDANGCTVKATVTVGTTAAPTVSSTSSTPAGCTVANGTATANGAGGTGAYTYIWAIGQTAQTATGLSSGNYPVTIKDANGCTVGGTVAVGVTANPTIASSSSTPAGCSVANGTATANGSGGTGGLTYIWAIGQTAQTATGLTSGSYSVTIKDANGCTVGGTVAVGVTANPTIASSSSTPAGCTVANGTATANGSGGTGAYTYIWAIGQTAQTATGLSSGSYSVTIKDANGCTVGGTVSVSVTANPTIASSSSTPAGCSVANGTATASGSGGTGAYTYIWSSGQTAQTATGLAGGDYTVTVKDANGCTVAGTVSVSATSVPSISSVTATVAGCGLANGTATVTATGGTGAYTYNWSGGQTTQIATGLAGGNYNVTVADANGCTQTGTVSVLNSGAPAVSNISSASFGCSAPYGVATVSVFGGTPGYVFVWSPGGQTTQTATGLTSGSYSVVVTDANNCSVSSSVSVTVNAAPTASITTTQSTCGNNNGTASANFAGGTPGYTYSWSNGATTSAISNLAPGNYSVTISDNSCNISGIELVTNGDFTAGDINFSSTYTTCVPNCSEGSYAVGTDPFAVHAAWAACGDHTSGSGNFMIVNGAGTPGTDVWCQTVTVTPNTNYTFSAWVISQYTVSPAQLQFSINGSPLCAVFSAPSSLCTWTQFFCTWNSGANTTASICILNQNTTLGGNDFGLDDISFQSCSPCVVTATVAVTQPAVLATSTAQTNLLCNGANIGTASVSASAGSPAFTYSWSSGQTTSAISNLAAGNYSVTVTDANGCTSTNSLTITQPTVLSSSTTQSSILCNGGTANASVTSAGGTPGYTYNWSSGQSTSAINGIPAGNYSVTVTDANGCTSTNAFTITQPTALISSTSQAAILCNGGTANASVNAAGGTPGYSYSWSNGASTSSATGLTAGNYSVVVTDANGCTSTNTVTLTQPPILTLQVTGNDSLCAGDTVALTATPVGGTPAYTYVWTPGPQNGQTISVNPTASTTYSVVTTDANGCTSITQVFSVSILPNPSALFDTISNGQYSSIFQFNDLSTGGTSWFWDFGDGTTSTLQNPVNTFPGAGTYTVTQIVYNQFGCPDTFRIVLDFEDGIIIPNVFTPDGDGINDVWFVPSSGLREYQLEIFDRWGLKVFENTADQIRWDGRSKAGILLSDGTYYFVLKAVLSSFNGDKDYSTKGHITLLTTKRKTN